MPNSKWPPAKSIKFSDDEMDLIETVRELREDGSTLVVKEPALQSMVRWWLTSPDSPVITDDWSKVPDDRREGIKRVVTARAGNFW